MYACVNLAHACCRLHANETPSCQTSVVSACVASTLRIAIASQPRRFAGLDEGTVAPVWLPHVREGHVSRTHKLPQLQPACRHGGGAGTLRA